VQDRHRDRDAVARKRVRARVEARIVECGIDQPREIVVEPRQRRALAAAQVSVQIDRDEQQVDLGRQQRVGQRCGGRIAEQAGERQRARPLRNRAAAMRLRRRARPP
jgi:hypothetical protein